MNHRAVTAAFLNVMFACTAVTPAFAQGPRTTDHSIKTKPQEALEKSPQDCFKQLDGADQLQLAHIVQMREELKKSNVSDEKIQQVISNEVGKLDSDQKRAAATAVIADINADDKVQYIFNMINRNVAAGQKSLQPKQIADLTTLLSKARELDPSIPDVTQFQALNASMYESAQALKAQGATISHNGEWDMSNWKGNPESAETIEILKSSFPQTFYKMLDATGKKYKGTSSAAMGSKLFVRDATKKTTEYRFIDASEYTRKVDAIIKEFSTQSQIYLENSRAQSHWLNKLKNIAGEHETPYTVAMNKSSTKMIASVQGLTKLGMPREETDRIFQMLRDVINQGDAHNDEGIEKVKMALITITAAPLAYVALPAFGAMAAGTTGATTTLGAVAAWTGVAGTVAGVAIPLTMAGIKINDGMKDGSSLSCNLLKHGSEAGVSVVQTIEWGALGPALKIAAAGGTIGRYSVAGAGNLLQWVAKSPFPSLTLDGAKNLVMFVPGAYLAGKGLHSAGIQMSSSTEALKNIQSQLSQERQAGAGHEANVKALEQMESEAKRGNWESVANLSNSLVGLSSMAMSMQGSKPAPKADVPKLPASNTVVEPLPALPKEGSAANASTNRALSSTETSASALPPPKPIETAPKSLPTVKETSQTFSKETVIKNSKLDNAQRIQEAENVLGRELTDAQKKALIDAHEVAKDDPNAGVFKYKQQDIHAKASKLKGDGDGEDPHFSRAERRLLVESGLAGKPPAHKLTQYLEPEVVEKLTPQEREAIYEAFTDRKGNYYKTDDLNHQAGLEQAKASIKKYVNMHESNPEKAKRMVDDGRFGLSGIGKTMENLAQARTTIPTGKLFYRQPNKTPNVGDEAFFYDEHQVFRQVRVTKVNTVDPVTKRPINPPTYSSFAIDDPTTSFTGTVEYFGDTRQTAHLAKTPPKTVDPKVAQAAHQAKATQQRAYAEKQAKAEQKRVDAEMKQAKAEQDARAARESKATHDAKAADQPKSEPQASPAAAARSWQKVDTTTPTSGRVYVRSKTGPEVGDEAFVWDDTAPGNYRRVRVTTVDHKNSRYSYFDVNDPSATFFRKSGDKFSRTDRSQVVNEALKPKSDATHATRGGTESIYSRGDSPRGPKVGDVAYIYDSSTLSGVRKVKITAADSANDTFSYFDINEPHKAFSKMAESQFMTLSEIKGMQQQGTAAPKSAVPATTVLSRSNETNINEPAFEVLPPLRPLSTNTIPATAGSGGRRPPYIDADFQTSQQPASPQPEHSYGVSKMGIAATVTGLATLTASSFASDNDESKPQSPHSAAAALSSPNTEILGERATVATTLQSEPNTLTTNSNNVAALSLAPLQQTNQPHLIAEKESSMKVETQPIQPRYPDPSTPPLSPLKAGMAEAGASQGDPYAAKTPNKQAMLPPPTDNGNGDGDVQTQPEYKYNPTYKPLLPSDTEARAPVKPSEPAKSKGNLFTSLLAGIGSFVSGIFSFFTSWFK